MLHYSKWVHSIHGGEGAVVKKADSYRETLRALEGEDWERPRRVLDHETELEKETAGSYGCGVGGGLEGTVRSGVVRCARAERVAVVRRVPW